MAPTMPLVFDHRSNNYQDWVSMSMAFVREKTNKHIWGVLKGERVLGRGGWSMFEIEWNMDHSVLFLRNQTA